MLAGDMRKLNETGVKRFDLAFGEIFEKTAEGDEMIGLGDGFEVFAVAINFAVELEAIFADELWGDIFGFEIGSVEIIGVVFGSCDGRNVRGGSTCIRCFFTTIDAKVGVFFKNVERNIAEAK